MIDNLILQIASDLSSFCHLGNFLGAIPAGRKKRKLLIAGVGSQVLKIRLDKKTNYVNELMERFIISCVGGIG